MNQLYCSFCGVDLDLPHRENCVQEDSTIKTVSSGVIKTALKSGAAFKEEFMPRGEIRVVDEKSGGEKGMKLARFSLIPPDFVWALAEHYGKGSRKYADRNWEKGYKWSLSLDASQRHLHQWLQGEDNDEETGSSHLIAAIWHLVALWWFHRRNKGTNDIRLVDI